MTAMPQAYVPEAPAQCHIDVAAIVGDVASAAAASLPPMPHPEYDVMELYLLQAARTCAAGDSVQLPRRELVAVALREADRQQWWRDHAEAEKEAYRRKMEAMKRAHQTQLEELRAQRRGLLQLLFEIIAWAAPQLGCIPSGEAVLAAIRAKGSGWLQHDHDGGLIDRVRAEVGHG